MNGLRQGWLVASRELRERGRSRSFLVSVVLMLVAVAGAIVLPALLDTGPGTKDVGVTGAAPAGLVSALRIQGDSVDTTIRIERYDTLTAGEAAVRNGSLDVLVVDARQLEWPKRADEQLKAIVTGAIQLVTVQERAAAAGISPDDLRGILAPTPVSNVELGQTTGRSPGDENAAFIMSMLLFGAISTFAAMVLSGVVEEKSSRTVEVLLARMPARALLAGKIVGIGLLGLVQMTALAMVALVAGVLVDSVDIPAVHGDVLAWAVVWFLLGYALFATLFGTLGALASRAEDASSVTGPVTILLVLSFMVSFATFGSIDTTWARLVSWFPITAPLAMPFRVAMGAATWWDPVVAVVLTVASIAGLVALGGRVYTRAILHTGATLTMGDAWRDTTDRARRKTALDAGVLTQPSGAGRVATRDNPVALVVLIGLSTAVGGAVFALVGDFMVGLIVAAAFYALAVRAVKWRSNAGDEKRAERRHSERHPVDK
jgi:ABC-2 type transport system permease protein